jgi:hypothetical protein
MPEPIVPKTDSTESKPTPPSLDEMYTTIGRSLVWIHKLGDDGRHTDTALGFVIGKDQVATAFQAVDATTRLEVVFNDGRKVVSNEIWDCNRFQDWAVVKVDTGTVAALRRMENGTVPVGERYILFNVEREQTRVIGGVDISGKRTATGFGDRIQISPLPTQEAVGGPLLTPMRLVAGIVGGSLHPGSRFSRFAMSVSPALWSRLTADVSVTPIGALSSHGDLPAATLQSLLDQGILTPPLNPSASLAYGGSARALSKTPNDMTTQDASEFSHRDQVAWIYTLWRKKDKTSKGLVSAKVYDSRNHLAVNVVPKKISLAEKLPMRVAFDFPLAKFAAGVYRVDVLWNGEPAWRTFITVTD